MNGINALSEAEAIELNLPTLMDQDNPNILGRLGSPLPQTDKAGRQVISYKQYEELHRLGARMEGYALRMVWPGKGTINTIQASKFQKWYGDGYRPLGEFESLVQKRKVTAPESLPESGLPSDVSLFFCREKYPDCDRVFDRQKGLTFHWNKDHGEAPIRPRAVKPATED